MANLLGVDVGTTSLKTVLFDENGNELRSVTKSYNLISKGDTVEFHAEEYFTLFKSAFDEIKSEFEISALSIDTQCETLIVADENGKLLRNAIVWLDNRAAKEAADIEAHFGRKRVYEMTGQAEITATWPAAKLLWLKRNEPQVFEKTKKIFLLEDYLLFRLTGEFVTEKTLQSSTIYLDIKNGCYWKEMLGFIGVNEENLPRLCNSGEIIGEYEGVRVVTGVMDQIAGAIGAGVVEKGIVSEMTGTTMVLFVPTDSFPEYREESRVPCHVNFDGKYCLLMWTPTAGIALKWFKENFCEGYSFATLDELAKEIPVGCDGLCFLPYLCGSVMPIYKPDARGAFLGLTMEHTRAHMVRSILESVAFMLKENLDYMGIKCEEIRAMGGGAASELWCQIKSDLTKKKIVTLKNAESACLGSAIMAGCATGVFESVNSACEKLVRTKKSYLPKNVNYSAAYKRFIDSERNYL